MRALVAIILILFLCTTAYAGETLTHHKTITRAALEPSTMLNISGGNGFVEITQPNVMGVYGNLMYIVDSARRIVYRYNLSNERLVPLNSVMSQLTGLPNALTVAADGSFYLSDPFSRTIYHFTMLGQLRRTYKSEFNMSNPVAITLAPNGNLLVADRLFDHVLEFSPVGQALRAFGQRGVGRGKLLEVIDMVNGPDGIYVMDRLSQSVKVFSNDGSMIREMSRQEVHDPTAIAVDYAERVYISDAFDDTIKIYNRNGLIETFGGTGFQQGQFRMISDLHVDNSYLYVADSANDRIQVFYINPAFDADEAN